jgi:hypothetical protein
MEGGIFGTDTNKPGIAYITPKNETATITVLENSRGAFRAKVDGRVCEFDMNAAMAGKPKKCEPFFQISGEVSKPFAYLYQNTSQLVSHQTEGEKLYNKHQTVKVGFAALTSGGLGGGGSGPGSGAGGAGSGAGGALGCDCNCSTDLYSLSAECRPQCAVKLASCPPAPTAAATEAPSSPASTLADQREGFARLITGQGLSPEVEDMLITDFTAMSPETQAYMIEQYANGVR